MAWTALKVVNGVGVSSVITDPTLIETLNAMTDKQKLRVFGAPETTADMQVLIDVIKECEEAIKDQSLTGSDRSNLIAHKDNQIKALWALQREAFAKNLAGLKVALATVKAGFGFKVKADKSKGAPSFGADVTCIEHKDVKTAAESILATLKARKAGNGASPNVSTRKPDALATKPVGASA